MGEKKEKKAFLSPSLQKAKVKMWRALKENASTLLIGIVILSLMVVVYRIHQAVKELEITLNHQQLPLSSFKSRLEMTQERLNTLATQQIEYHRQQQALTAKIENVQKQLQTLPALTVLTATKETQWEKMAALIPLFSQLEWQSSWVESNSSSTGNGWKTTWQELKGLIKISRKGEEALPFVLTLQEKDQVLRTLFLLCEQAQWAFLHESDKIYHDSLNALEKRIKQYFTPNAVQATLLENIQQLNTVHVGRSQS